MESGRSSLCKGLGERGAERCGKVLYGSRRIEQEERSTGEKINMWEVRIGGEGVQFMYDVRYIQCINVPIYVCYLR